MSEKEEEERRCGKEARYVRVKYPFLFASESTVLFSAGTRTGSELHGWIGGYWCREG
jgi:hypothetical protein